jgi:hypothetical protein
VSYDERLARALEEDHEKRKREREEQGRIYAVLEKAERSNPRLTQARAKADARAALGYAKREEAVAAEEARLGRKLKPREAREIRRGTQ